MKAKRVFFLLGFLVGGLGLLPAFGAPPQAERILPYDIYVPDYGFLVQIQVTGEPGRVRVRETPPTGWGVKNVYDGGVKDQGTLTWDLVSFSGTQKLRYRVVPPPEAQGEAVFAGHVEGQPISGKDRMQEFRVLHDRLPPATGPYPVGTVSSHWVDSSRKETFTKDPSDFRELMVQFWYPAAGSGEGAPVRYHPDADLITPSWSGLLPTVPPVFWEQLAALQTHAVSEAPLSPSPARYPLVIFSHGHRGRRGDQGYLMATLASHGYIAVAIDHTYNATAVRFPDGRIAPAVAADLSQFVSSHMRDVQFVLDRLTEWDRGSPPSPFAGYLNVSRVGIVGRSLGGSVTGAVLKSEPRIQAGVSLDGDSGISGLPRPYLYIGTATPGGMSQHAQVAYACLIGNTEHSDYSELPLCWAWIGLPGLYPVNSQAQDPQRTTRIIQEYTLAFFDRFLRGAEAPLLDNPEPAYPEVKFTVYGPPEPVSSVGDYENYP